MANPELDTLREQLLAHGVTAPKSWNTARLEKELEKYVIPKVATEQPTDNIEEESTTSDIEQSADNVDIDALDESADDADNIEEESTTSDIEQSADNIDIDELDESADDAEDLDDNVMIEAVADFTPKRLKLGRKLPGDKFTVPSEDAEFFVKIDRTCKYHDA